MNIMKQVVPWCNKDELIPHGYLVRSFLVDYFKVTKTRKSHFETHRLINRKPKCNNGRVVVGSLDDGRISFVKGSVKQTKVVKYKVVED